MDILSDVKTMQDLADKAGSYYGDKYWEAEMDSKDRAWYGFKMHQAHAVYWALAAKERNNKARSPLYAGDDELSRAERYSVKADAKLYQARANDHYAKAEANHEKWRTL